MWILPPRRRIRAWRNHGRSNRTTAPGFPSICGKGTGARSDGQPLTSADDVVFTWNDVIYNPDIVNVTRAEFQMDKTNFTITKVDDLTVRVVTPKVYAPFLQFFGSVARDSQTHPGRCREEQVLCVRLFRDQHAARANRRLRPVPHQGISKTGPICLLLERNPQFWETGQQGPAAALFRQCGLYHPCPKSKTRCIAQFSARRGCNLAGTGAAGGIRAFQR